MQKDERGTSTFEIFVVTLFLVTDIKVGDAAAHLDGLNEVT